MATGVNDSMVGDVVNMSEVDVKKLRRNEYMRNYRLKNKKSGLQIGNGKKEKKPVSSVELFTRGASEQPLADVLKINMTAEQLLSLVKSGFIVCDIKT